MNGGDQSGPIRSLATYERLLNTARDGTDGTRWIGEYGFYLDPPEREAMRRRRWRGMHPDLLPFARDGWGNRFCFVDAPDALAPEGFAIVYWMYETFAAVPIASSFEAFLRWVGLSTWAHARDPHYETVSESDFEDAAAVLESVGCCGDFDRLLPMPAPTRRDVLQAGLTLDPQSPALLVESARRSVGKGPSLKAVAEAQRAAEHFRGFGGAHRTVAELVSGEASGPRFDALLKALHAPLTFHGDADMPWFRGIPSADASAVSDALLAHPKHSQIDLDAPIWEIAHRLDPANPLSWAEVALSYADEGELRLALPMACNAMHCAISDRELLGDMERLVDQLYVAMGWEPRLAAS